MELFKLLVALAPMLLDIVQALEKAFPIKGQGDAKLALALETVGTIIEADPHAKAAVAGVDWKIPVTQIINANVATMKTTGVFPA